MDGLAINASWNPAASAGVNSALGLGVTYTGVEGLSVSYATIDINGHAATDEGDETAMKASYAYGPVTVSYSQFDTDQGTSTSATDLEMTSMAFLTLYQMNFHLLTVQKHLTQVILLLMLSSLVSL